MSYLIGARLGDGFVCEVSGKSIVGLKVKDKDFAVQFAKCLKQVLSNEKIYFQNDQGYWRVVTHSHELFVFLKSKDVHNYSIVIKCHPTEFIRGVADSEGCVSIHSKKRGYLRVKIANTDIELLKFVQVLLAEFFNIESRIQRCSETPKTKHILYALEIRKQMHIARFANFIGFSIRRKTDRLSNIFDVEKRMKRHISLYQEVRKLHREGYGYRRIAKKLNIPKGTVTFWVRGIYNPLYLE